MSRIDYNALLQEMKGTCVERPNKADAGTLSGHAAGEPFEKSVYQHLKTHYPNAVFKQYEFLNDLYLKHPKVITVEDGHALLDSPTALFLLSRGDTATRAWSPQNIFEEKQNDTADIIFYHDHFYDLIDVKTRNINKNAQPPNIISAYKLAKTCACMLDNGEFDTIGINYIEIDWQEQQDFLHCCDAHYANLFKANPAALYINWAAAMQIQFHVVDLDQSWNGTLEQWAREYIRTFVKSAQRRCDKMREEYITPFLKYIQE